MQVFSKEWFKVHTLKLTRLANTWIGRRIFGITKLVKGEVVVDIGPNYVSTYAGYSKETGAKVKTRTFTFTKMAYCLHKNIKLFWWALHFIDWLALDRQQLVPSFGFSTLTDLYTESGLTGPDEACEAQLHRQSVIELWGQIATQTATINSSGQLGVKMSSYSATDYWDINSRSVFHYDTDIAVLKVGTVAAASMFLYGWGQSDIGVFWDGFGEDKVRIFDPVAADYSLIPGTVSLIDYAYLWEGGDTYGSISVSEFDTDWMEITMSNLDNINNDDWTVIGMAAIKDYSAIPTSPEPTWSASTDAHMLFRTSADAGMEPYLETISGGFIQINVGDVWKDAVAVKININNVWQPVTITNIKINPDDVWR